MHIFPKRAPLQELGGEILKLVSYSATPKQWAEWLRVPLEHAAARGNLGLVDALLEAGADGSAGWRGCRRRSLLDAAAVGGSVDVVTALLRAGAQPDVNVVSLSPRRSALYVATVLGHEEVARCFILAGANVRFEDPVEQCSVLHEAAWGGLAQLVNDLLIGGADPNRTAASDVSTPLHLAARCGHGEIVSALLLGGADKDALDRYGTTPLMYAAGRGWLAAVEILLAAGADFNIRAQDNSNSALDEAAIGGHLPVIKAILGHGADVNYRDSCDLIGGLSALHKAAALNQADAIDALVEAGANIELVDNAGHTPLFLAALFSQSESMLALFKRGATVMVGGRYKISPLHGVCHEKHSGMEAAVDLLLRWGADETAVDISGQTPADSLNEALDDDQGRCSQGEVESVRLMLARAPADRAWRRRGWLVMLRSRASKAEVAGHGNGGNSGNNGDRLNVNVAGNREGRCRKAARTEGEPEAGVQHGVREQRSSEGDEVGGLLGVEGGDGAEASGMGFGGIVALLLGLEIEGVFRSVVSLL